MPDLAPARALRTPLPDAPPDAPPAMDRRAFLRRGALLGAAGAAALGGYAWRVEPHWLDLVVRPLAVRGLPAAWHGARLLQVSDVHVGPRVDDAFLIDALARAAAHRPDLVVVTGDLLTHRVERGEAQYAQLDAVLAHLPRGPRGTLAVLGNHDYGPGWRDHAVAARVAAVAARHGVRVLRNAVATLDGLDVVGVDDLWSGTADPARALAARAGDAALVLCHNPDTVDGPGWDGFAGWVLAGHTHGGQCRPPFLPPPILPVRNRRYAAGEVDAGGGRRLYVSRGLGHASLPVRFNVRPELTLFTLVPAPRGG